MTPDPQALADVIARVVKTLQAGGEDAAARARVAADVDALRETLTQAVPAAGVLPGVNFAQVAEALRIFGAWLHAPTAAGELQAERAMTDLQAAVGPLVGWDPDREDAAKRAQYRREARAALDGIFDKPKG